MSATLSCWKMTDALSDAARSTSMASPGRDSFDLPWDPASQSGGGGRRLVKALLAQAEKHKVTCVCLFTRIPDSSHTWIHCRESPGPSGQIHKDCLQVPQTVSLRRGGDDPWKSAHVRQSCPPPKNWFEDYRHDLIAPFSRERFVCLVAFLFSASAAGIKVSGRPDLAAGGSRDGASGWRRCSPRTGVVAAPVEFGRASLLFDGRPRSRRRRQFRKRQTARTGTRRHSSCEQVCREAARPVRRCLSAKSFLSFRLAIHISLSSRLSPPPSPIV